jgi:rhodanese-related sulfurtransferase
LADPVGLTPDMMSVTVETPGGPVEIMREQDNDAPPGRRLDADLAALSEFLHPADGARRGRDPGGRAGGSGGVQDPGTVVVDGRIRPQFEAGTIPGAVSVPYTEAADRLGELGCEVDFDGWICEGDLPQVVLFCNGPWCGQSPTAARRMIEAGFPAENISYYRGGMQNWNMLGLTVVPGGPSAAGAKAQPFAEEDRPDRGKRHQRQHRIATGAPRFPGGGQGDEPERQASEC